MKDKTLTRWLRRLAEQRKSAEAGGADAEAGQRLAELTRSLKEQAAEASRADLLKRLTMSPEKRFSAQAVGEDQGNLLGVGILQLLLLGLFCAAWWKLGAVLTPAIVGATVGLLLAIALSTGYSIKRPTQTGTERWGYLWWLEWAGYLLLLFFLTLLFVLLTQRFFNNRIFYGLVIVVFNFLVLQPLTRFDQRRRENGHTSLAIAGALALGPLLAAWVVASLPLFEGRSSEGTVRGWLDEAVVESVAARQATIGCDPWPEDIRVAVTLSGGGYRAALVHAGLLAALDERCVPIHLLSTVSGGSIIGTAYAAGLPPREFARRLSDHKPGLPAAMLDLTSVLVDLFASDRSISDVYSQHFSTVFFGERTLEDLSATPLLLINATDLESGVEAREVFFRGRVKPHGVPGETLDGQIRLADIVAASGAFPGPFRPKGIKWVAADSSAVRSRQFVDGGLIDNLGVEGLRRYLTLPREDGRRPERPHILILSDAGDYRAGSALDPKPDVVGLLARSSDVAYRRLHQILYYLYTGHREIFSWIQEQRIDRQVGEVSWGRIDPSLMDGVQPERLLSVTIAPTSPAMPSLFDDTPQCRFGNDESAADVQRQVSNFDTLDELGPDQVRRAFWLGYVAGRLYLPTIECARARLTGDECRETPTLLNCPTVDELMKSRGG